MLLTLSIHQLHVLQAKLGSANPKKGGKMYNVYTLYRITCNVGYCLISLGAIMLAGAIVWQLAAWHHDDLVGYFRAHKLCNFGVLIVLADIYIVYCLKQLSYLL